MFQALARGYLDAAASFLVKGEVDNLVRGGQLMTMETGIRFLTDYLSGDSYFKTDYPRHNLIRTRSQIALVRDIEGHMEEFEEYIENYFQKING